jgi:hypothetical protein
MHRMWKTHPAKVLTPWQARRAAKFEPFSDLNRSQMVRKHKFRPPEELIKKKTASSRKRH